MRSMTASPSSAIPCPGAGGTPRTDGRGRSRLADPALAVPASLLAKSMPSALNSWLSCSTVRTSAVELAVLAHLEPWLAHLILVTGEDGDHVDRPMAIPSHHCCGIPFEETQLWPFAATVTFNVKFPPVTYGHDGSLRLQTNCVPCC